MANKHLELQDGATSSKLSRRTCARADQNANTVTGGQLLVRMKGSADSINAQMCKFLAGECRFATSASLPPDKLDPVVTATVGNFSQER